MNKDVIDRILNFDPIYEVEKTSRNKHWSEFTDDENSSVMGLTMVSGEYKRNMLKTIGDTYHGMTFNEFISLIENNGFKKAMRYTFKNNVTYLGNTDEFACYYRNDGLVIVCDSCGDSLNSGNVYGNYKKKDPEDYAFIGGSGGGFGEGRHYFDKDIREGLFHFLSKIDDVADLINPWQSTGMFHWMLDRTDRKSDNNEPYESWNKRYIEITKDKLSKCPKEMLDIVNVYFNNK